MTKTKTKTKKKTATKKAVPATRKFKLTVDAQPMVVRYNPAFGFDQGHFEFRSPYNPPRRIPVSTTGYYSAFAPLEDVAAAPSVADFARALVLNILHEKSRARPKDPAQLEMF